MKSKPVISLNNPPRVEGHALACFITPHGFGHAARACAVLESIYSQDPSFHFELFTRVPPWFFAESLPSGCFTYHDTLSDIGLVQPSPFVEDLPATLHRLAEYLPPDPAEVDRLAGEISSIGCHAVLCDIAPLGIAVAHVAGLPSILVENFTWDWIYAGYLDQEKGFDRFIPLFHDLFARASIHIQTEPVCEPSPSAALTTGPVSRNPHHPRSETRTHLEVPEDATCVLVSMGGVPFNVTDLTPFGRMDNEFFIIPGGSPRLERRGNLVLLPHHTPIYHPDLVSACDILIGKSGYSTIAEAYHAGIPFGFVSRARFREAGPVGEFIRRKMGGVEIPESAFLDGAWTQALAALRRQPRRTPVGPNGAESIARYILSQVISSHP